MGLQGQEECDRDEIRRALSDHEFVVHYQLQFDLGTQAISGVEALVRWQHPRLGLLWPSRFLNLLTLEQSRLMTRQIVAQVARDARHWQRGAHRLSVSLNVSPNELIHGELVALMNELQRSLGGSLPLVLEITESNAMQDELVGSEIAARLHLLGMELSVDDFGIGFSSLARLQLLPISEIKIDRSFVRFLDDNVQDAAIVEAMALLGQRLGIRVVAEGGESLESLARLARFGCTHAQGFALARPMPAADFIELLASLDTTPAPAVPHGKALAANHDVIPRLVVPLSH